MDKRLGNYEEAERHRLVAERGRAEIENMGQTGGGGGSAGVNGGKGATAPLKGILRRREGDVGGGVR